MTGPNHIGADEERSRRRRSDIAMDTLDPDVPRGLRKAASDQRNDIHSATGSDLLPPPPPSIRHLTETDLARRWRMSVRTLQAWRWKKIGPGYLKAMGKVLYRLSDIETFEAEHLRGGQR